MCILLAPACLAAVLLLAAAPAFAAEDDKPDCGVTGGWGGARTSLHNKGLDLGATEIFDIFGNVSGGTSRDAVFEGRLEMVLDADVDKMVGLKGLTGHVNAYQIHGRGLSASTLNNNIATSTGIEAERATRLFTLWLQQNFMDDAISVRVGQLAADDEFVTTTYGGLFTNSVYGWPSSLATNLPGGGPAYPLAAPGVRLRLGGEDPWSFQTAVFSGDPSGGGTVGTAQQRNPSGTRFPVNNGAFWISEVGYKNEGESVRLPGTYKAGFWYHTQSFSDPRYGTDGLSLANTGSNGITQRHEGNDGFYGVIDQMLWTSKEQKGKTVAGFTRFLWNPSDRNTIAYQLDAGLNFIGFVPGREDDVFGVAFSYLPISGHARGFDADTNFFNSANAPVRRHETQLEITYQAPLTPWLTVQPDFQYIFNPGGYVVDPKDTAGVRPVGDAAVFGLRLIGKF